MQYSPARLSNNKDLQASGLGFMPLVEMAKLARLDQEEWVKRALLALAVSDNPALAQALAMKFKLRILAEELEPFPFSTPGEMDFL